MYKPILRRVGLVLLVVGLYDLAWTIYRAREGQGFQYDGTILAAGIALLFGRIKTAVFMRRLTAFGAIALGCFGVLWLATLPVASTLAALRSQPLDVLEEIASYFSSLLLCVWTFRELGRPEILAEEEKIAERNVARDSSAAAAPAPPRRA